MKFPEGFDTGQRQGDGSAFARAPCGVNGIAYGPFKGAVGFFFGNEFDSFVGFFFGAYRDNSSRFGLGPRGGGDVGLVALAGSPGMLVGKVGRVKGRRWVRAERGGTLQMCA